MARQPRISTPSCSRIVAAYPNDHLGANTITLDPMWRSPFGANGYMAATLPILLAIAAVVLLLTCANVATLTLVRFVSRRRETRDPAVARGAIAFNWCGRWCWRALCFPSSQERWPLC